MSFSFAETYKVQARIITKLHLIFYRLPNLDMLKKVTLIEKSIVIFWDIFSLIMLII